MGSKNNKDKKKIFFFAPEENKSFRFGFGTTWRVNDGIFIFGLPVLNECVKMTYTKYKLQFLKSYINVTQKIAGLIKSWILHIQYDTNQAVLVHFHHYNLYCHSNDPSFHAEVVQLPYFPSLQADIAWWYILCKQRMWWDIESKRHPNKSNMDSYPVVALLKNGVLERSV